jgi:hypothetical protein
MVAFSQFGLSNIGKGLDPSDVQYTADLAHFILGLTKSQRPALSHILAMTVSKVERDGVSQKMWKTTIPTNPFLLRKHFWEGKQAFLENIPTPSITSIGDHGYVSLRDCIRLRLSFGFPLEKLVVRESLSDRQKGVRSLMQSECSQRIIERCKHMYNEEVLILQIKEWQDGYDPHSFSKTNRGSAWIKLVTIAEPHDNRNDPDVSHNTILFVICFHCFSF